MSLTSGARGCICATLSILAHLLCLCVAADETVPRCPAVSSVGCGRQCQTHLCNALAQVFRASNNVSDPWDNSKGWKLTATESCTALVAEAAHQTPAVYCSWFGVLCCTPAAIAAGNCTILDTVSALSMPMNNMNVSLENSEFMSAIQQLHDCGLTVLNLEANNLSGQVKDKQWGGLRGLRVINIANSWIEGPIPTTLRQMRNLTRINLSNSYMYGTIPQWIGELRHLELLNLGTMTGLGYGSGLTGTIPSQLGMLQKLKELILESNLLSGTLPPQLCQGGDSSTLLLINLRANSFEGPASILEGCGNLVQLDISSNNFSGPLPASTSWGSLTTYQASYNNFSGEFPCNLCHSAQMLETLDVSHNQLTSQIPNTITLLSGLKTLNVGYNQFTGTLTENIYNLPGIKVLDFSNNKFVGTIPPGIQFPYGLTTADYSNNTGFTGILPPQTGFLYNLQKFRTTGTNMSCSGIIVPYNITTNDSCNDPARCTTPLLISDESQPGGACSDEELLPCFLRFSNDPMPREDASNMRCKFILRKPPAEAKADCAQGSEPYTLGSSAQYLPDISKDSTEQSWIIHPSYYQYRGCTCLQGYSSVWDANGTVLKCVEAGAVDKRGVILVSAISAVAGLALLAVLLLLAQLYLRTRPRWLRERIMQAKRRQGAPKCGKPGDKARVSIVVTDVKDFSALTGQYHELMMKAMGAHNNILRKACHAHAGTVMDQEGDSWTVAFHEPQDAVAFGLQVQQALSQKAWGVRLRGHSPSDDPGVWHSGTLGSNSSGGPFSKACDAAAATGKDVAAVAAAEISRRQQTLEASQHQQEQDCQVTCRSQSFMNPLSVSFTSSVRSEAGQSSSSGTELVQGSFTGIAKILSRRSGSRTNQGSDIKSPRGWQQPRHCDSDPLPQIQPVACVQGLAPSPSSQGISDPEGHPTTYMGSQSISDISLRLGSQLLSDTGQSAASPSGINSSQQQRQQQPDIEFGTAFSPGGVGRSGSSFCSQMSAFDRAVGALSSRADKALSGSLFGPSRRRSRNGATALLQRFSQITSKASSVVSGGELGHPLKVLRIAVRIGIASGPLPYGSSLGNCAVKHRAKNIISEAAAGGQVLVDESTFVSIKDSLSVLGTVNEHGYDHELLQQLMHAQVVGKLQRQVGCAVSPCLRPCDSHHQLSFTGGLWSREPQDYDNDAIAVHMGCFEVPDAPTDDPTASSSTSESSSPTCQCEELELVDIGGDSTATTAISGAAYRCSRQKLHMYSIASPGMRRQSGDRKGLGSQGQDQEQGWAEPVTMKAGWVQTQNGYFEAPSACQMDLTPGSHLLDTTPPALSEVTVIFTSVTGASTFSSKHTQKDIQAVNKAIIKCMLQQINNLPGRDGYLCRCQESDLRYMVAFEQPHKAVQWCLLVQEALMYVPWAKTVLSHPAFREEVCPRTGRVLFRGPRLRMGFAEGQPNSVLPDHNGRANYYGGSVNCAARYMDAAAHGGQVVTDVELARKIVREWQRDAIQRAEEALAPRAQRDSFSRSEPQRRLTTIVSFREPADVHDPLAQKAVCSTGSEAGSVEGTLYDLPTEADQQLQPLPTSQQSSQHSLFTQQHLQGTSYTDPLQQLVKRSASETAAPTRTSRSRHDLPPLPRHTEGRHSSNMLTVRCQSFTETLPLSSVPTGLRDPQFPADVCAAPGTVTPILEDVGLQHLGRFSFKGSGDHDMVQFVHAAIADRTFPGEPPKGKGHQVTAADPRVVAGLAAVRLQIPAPVVAARHAYKLLEYESE